MKIAHRSPVRKPLVAIGQTFYKLTMTQENNQHSDKLPIGHWGFILFFIFNLADVVWQLYTVKTDGSDKAPIVIMVMWPLLVIVDTIIWTIVRRFNQGLDILFKRIIIALLILFLPALVYSIF